MGNYIGPPCLSDESLHELPDRHDGFLDSAGKWSAQGISSFAEYFFRRAGSACVFPESVAETSVVSSVPVCIVCTGDGFYRAIYPWGCVFANTQIVGLQAAAVVVTALINELVYRLSMKRFTGVGA